MRRKRSLETEENSLLTCPGETFSEVDLDCVTTTKKKKTFEHSDRFHFKSTNELKIMSPLNLPKLHLTVLNGPINFLTTGKKIEMSNIQIT